jgi:predicted dehydrogenase
VSEKKIKFAIIGCGLFGKRTLIPAFRHTKYAELLGITKRDLEEAILLARKKDIPLAYAYEDLDKMLINPEIEAVYIASPNKMHHKDAIESLMAGKHVLIEKPMSMNAKECEEIIKVANENDRKLMVAHCFRFSSTIQHIKKLIDDGRLGNLIMGSCDFMSQGRLSSRSWKYNKEMAGGGAAFDLGVHMIDILRFLNPEPISSISLVKWPDPLPENYVDEFATFTMTFKNGFVGRATGSYYGPRHTSLTIYGTEGMVRCFDWHLLHRKIEMYREIGDKAQMYFIENDDHYTMQIDAFAKSILNNTPVPISGEEGLINQRIIDQVNL